MIIEIDNSCLEKTDQVFIEAIDTLAIDRSKQKNFIFAETHILKQISLIDGLSNLAKRVFESLSKKAAESKGIYNFSQYIIRIVNKPLNPVTHLNGKTIFQVSLEDIRNKEYTCLPLFVVENLVDAKFYELLTMAFLIGKHGRLPSPMKYDVRHGGGSTTASVLDELRKTAKYSILCVVDSDKRFPLDTLGETAKNIDRLNIDTEREFILCYTLGVREAENLLPWEWMKTIVAEKRKLESESCVITNLFQENPECQHYYDLKDGFSKKHLDDSGFCDYWLPILSKTHNREIKKTEIDRLEDYLPAFLSTTLENITQMLDDPQVSKDIKQRKFSGPTITECEKISEMFFSFFVVGRRIT
jgi:hypothetical protein